MTISNKLADNGLVGTVSAALASAFVEFACEAGADRAELEALSGVSTRSFNDLDARLPLTAYARIVRAAKACSGDPALPLRFASSADFSSTSIVGLIAIASDTMMDALIQLNRYGQIAVDTPFSGRDLFEQDMSGGEVWLTDTRDAPKHFPELIETTFTYFITGPRRFLPEPHVLEVEVTFEKPAHSDVIDEIWQCPVTYGAKRNALRLVTWSATHRVRQQPEYTFGILTRHADELLETLRASKTVQGQVEATLMPLLHTGAVTAEAIARRMGKSRQGLYRELKQEDTTFEATLDSLRHRLAVDYLETGKASVAEVSHLLGFSEPSAFSRAFKRWTGKSPAQFRSR